MKNDYVKLMFWTLFCAMMFWDSRIPARNKVCLVCFFFWKFLDVKFRCQTLVTERTETCLVSANGMLMLLLAGNKTWRRHSMSWSSCQEIFPKAGPGVWLVKIVQVTDSACRTVYIGGCEVVHVLVSFNTASTPQCSSIFSGKSCSHCDLYRRRNDFFKYACIEIYRGTFTPGHFAAQRYTLHFCVTV